MEKERFLVEVTVKGEKDWKVIPNGALDVGIGWQAQRPPQHGLGISGVREKRGKGLED